MDLTITGASAGLTDAQIQVAKEMLAWTPWRVIRHAGFPGADAQIHELVMDSRPMCMPCITSDKDYEGHDLSAYPHKYQVEVYPASEVIAVPPAGVDRIAVPGIVGGTAIRMLQDSDELVAFPGTSEPSSDSGTWVNIHAAVSHLGMSKKVTVVLPDGNVHGHRSLTSALIPNMACHGSE